MHSPRSRTVSRHRAAIIILAASALVACGGSDDTASDATVDAADATTDVTVGATTDVTTGATTDVTVDDTPAAGLDDPEPATSDDAADEAAAATTDATTDSGTAYEAGPIGYRVVSLIEQPVDVYVRTTGLVEAFEAALGVEPGAVTELFFPPEGGPLVITTAGAGDPTCVASCDHILTKISAFEDSGDVHTLLLYDANDRIETYDLYEDPEELVGNANELVAADPSSGLFVVVAVDVTDADFGMNLGLVGVEGCVESINLGPDVLVGGNQTPAFSYDGDTTGVAMYANDDRECAGTPVGGPFTVEGGAGTRSLLFLTGSPGDMEALVVPFVNSEAGSGADADTDTDADAASNGELDTAYELMADELSLQIGLDPADSACLAPYVVDAIGLDVALADGELIDLDTADAVTQDLAFDGLLAGVEACGIDPTVLGG